MSKQIKIIITIILFAAIININGAIFYFEDFETGIDSFGLVGTLWEAGSPSNEGPSTAWSGSKCIGTNIDGKYTSGIMQASILLPVLDLSSINDAKLIYYEYLDMYGNDKVQVLVRLDTELSGTGETLMAYYGPGSGGVWRQKIVDISSYSGQPTVRIKFKIGPTTGAGPGWYIDKLAIMTNPPEPDNLQIYAGNEKAFLTWNIAVDTSVIYYKIYRSTDPVTSYEVIDTLWYNQTSYYDYNLQNDITYYYSVTAVDTYELESSYSDSAAGIPGNRFNVELLEQDKISQFMSPHSSGEMWIKLSSQEKIELPAQFIIRQASSDTYSIQLDNTDDTLPPYTYYSNTKYTVLSNNDGYGTVSITAVTVSDSISLYGINTFIIDTEEPSYYRSSTLEEYSIYSNDKDINISIELSEPGDTVYADFSALDSNFDTSLVEINDYGNGVYKITYDISDTNNQSDSDNVLIPIYVYDPASNGPLIISDITVELDNTEPTSNITLPVTNTNKSGKILITSNQSPNDIIYQLYYYQSYYDTGDDIIFIDTASISPYSIEYDMSELRLGKYYLFSRAVDKAGNIEQNIDSVIITIIDDIDPTGYIDNIQNNGTVPLSSAFYLHATVTDNNPDSSVESVLFQYKRILDNSWTDIDVIDSNPNDGFAVYWNNSYLNPGDIIKLRLIITDASNNTNSTPDEYTIQITDAEVDKIPSASIIRVGDDTYPNGSRINGESLTIICYTEDNDIYKSSIEYRKSSDTIYTSIKNEVFDTAGNKFFIAQLSSLYLTDGETYYIRCRTTDFGGIIDGADYGQQLSDTDPEEYMFIYDVSAPKVSISNIDNNSVLYMNALKIIDVDVIESSNDINLVILRYKSVLSQDWNIIDTNTFAPCTYVFSTFGIEEGIYYLQPVAYDQAGNYDTTYQTLTVEIKDVSPPHSTIDNFDDDNFPYIYLSAVGIEDDIQKYIFEFSKDNGQNWNVISDTNPYDTYVFWNISGLEDSGYIVRSTAVDTNGNSEISDVNDYKIKFELLEGNIYLQNVIPASPTALEVNLDIDTINSRIELSFKDLNKAPESIIWNYYNNNVYTFNNMYYLSGKGIISDNYMSNNGKHLISITADISDNVSKPNLIYKEVDFCRIFVKKDIDYIDNDNIQSISGNINLDIAANTFDDNVYLIFKPVFCPVTSGTGVIPVNQIYDFSLETERIQNKNVELKLKYNDVNSDGIVDQSGITEDKLYLCYFDSSDSTWRNNFISSVTIDTVNNIVKGDISHFSVYSIVADYSDPEIIDYNVYNNIITGKVTDRGSGIKNIRTYIAGQIFTGDFDTTTGSFFITVNLNEETVKPYTLEISDNVGNKVTKEGVLTITLKQDILDLHNYPNPFNPKKTKTNISFINQNAAALTMNILDYYGNVVRNIFTAVYFNAGKHIIIFDGENNYGEHLSSGTYFIQLKNLAGQEIIKTFKMGVYYK